MLQLGKKQKLVVVKEVDFGIYLAEEAENVEEKVLLPKKQIPAGCKVGDEIEVFLYKDSKDRLIATTNQPKLQMGEVAILKVSQVTKIGAFLDWGLEKDLLLPYKEQTKKVKEGEEVLAAVYIDKSSRLCATMNVYEYLSQDSPYHKDDTVTGRVYLISKNFGAFVAVDDKYSALIAQKELFKELKVGEMIQGRVTDIKNDGKIDISIREKAYLQIEKDGEILLDILESYSGVLPFNDKASPEIIKRETNMSKNEFKRAVGHLLKAGTIEIGSNCIRKK